jgi:hypothetical protein
VVVGVVSGTIPPLARVAHARDHREGIELVHGRPVAALDREELLDEGAGLEGHMRHDAHGVLRGVPEAYSAVGPEAELIEREVSRPVLRDEALPRVMHVDHRIE